MKERDHPHVPLTVLVTVEPLSYREAIGGAIQQIRPNIEVVIGEPATLHSDVACLHPQLVICDQPGDATPEVVPAWVELCLTDTRSEAMVRIGYQQALLTAPGLANLISIVDRTESLVCGHHASAGR